MLFRSSASPPRNLTMSVISKTSYDKTGLGYTGEGSSSSEPKKEVRFVSAKNEEKLKEVKPEIETLVVVKRTIGARSKEKGSHYPKIKGKRALREACVSSLWHTRAHKAELFQASCAQEG